MDVQGMIYYHNVCIIIEICYFYYVLQHKKYRLTIIEYFTTHW